jgi:hypothetical protein
VGAYNVLPQLEKFPFLTLGRYLDQEYLGIVGNSDNQITSMYVYNLLHDEEAKKLFLQLGDEWWWETNRQMPINVTLKDRWSVFRPILKSFISSDFEILHGPCVSLDTVMVKRVKRRQIQLVRKLD